MKIYPNPAKDIIRVDIPAASIYNISIINVQGAMIQAYISTSTNLNIQSLSPGFYCIKITSEKDSYIGKFIKQ